MSPAVPASELKARHRAMCAFGRLSDEDARFEKEYLLAVGTHLSPA